MHGHLCDGGGHLLDLGREGCQMALQDGVVDLEERLLIGEGHVEDGEERHEARVCLVAPAPRLAHSRNVVDVLHVLPIQIFTSVVDAPSLQQQLQQSYGLLRAVRVHLM